MKLFIVCAVAALATIQSVKADDNPKNIGEAFTVCAKEQNISENAELKEDDPVFQCLMRCVYTKLNVVDANGNLIMGGLEKLLSRKFNDEQRKKIDECETTYRDADKCKQVAKSQTCIAQKLN